MDLASRLAELERAFPAILRDAPLARYSWVGLGGPADLLLLARTEAELVGAVQMAQALEVPWRVFGGLSNCLIPDEGLRGLVVLNRTAQVQWDAAQGTVSAASGVAMVTLAREAVQRGLDGLTWAVSLPGSLGGALINNAGAFGEEVGTRLVSAQLLARDGTRHTVGADWFGYSYRHSVLKGQTAGTWLLLAAQLQLTPADPQLLEARAQEFMLRRKRSQPTGRSLGSVFANPPGDYAGRLIEAAGLKGRRIGGVVVSDVHANFFINEGGTAADYRALVAEVQAEVERRFGIHLRPEIEILTAQLTTDPALQ